MNKKISKKLALISICSVLSTFQNKNNVYANNNEIPAIEAITDVNIRELNNTNSNIIGLLKEGNKIDYSIKLQNGWYKVIFNDEIGYINADFVKETTLPKEELNYNKMIYMLQDKTLIMDFDKEIVLPQYELAQVLYDYDNYYIVKSEDKIGYITKEYTEKLPKEFITVDISDQEVNYYNKNDIEFTSSAVTGLPIPSRETHLGYYKIFEISYNRDLVAADNSYRSYVDVMMKFNKGQGLHDAEYHKDYDENGKLKKSHGWRSSSEFGGDTYLHNGSHGCVNMPHDKAIELSEKVTIGTRVLVKK